MCNDEYIVMGLSGIDKYCYVYCVMMNIVMFIMEIVMNIVMFYCVMMNNMKGLLFNDGYCDVLLCNNE